MDNEIDFEQKLMQKYPDLFCKNEDGSLNCPCGIWVPVGWQKIVDDLCGAINNYIKCTYRIEREITSKKYYCWHYISKFFDWVHRRCIKLFPRFNKCKYNKMYFAFIRKTKQQECRYIKYNKVSPVGITIDQVKEKFGELRFYHSGGDKEVDGMVRFAEYLVSRTCEVSGERGELCVRGGWYKTLSETVRNTQLYQGYVPVVKTVNK